MVLFFFFFLFSANVSTLCILYLFFFFFFTSFNAANVSSLVFLLCSLFFNQAYSLVAFSCFFICLLCFFHKLCLPGWLGAFLAFIPVPIFKFLKVSTSLSLTLWNGLVFIHPTLMALSFFFIMCVLKDFYFKFLQRKDFFFFKRLELNFFFLTSVSSLVLGALWAQQELNWGGWWGWDAVEVGCLYICVFVACQYHHLFKKIDVCALFYFCLFFTVGIRCNFFNSVHSFVSSSFLFNSWLLFFFIVIICYFFAFFFSKRFFSFFYFLLALIFYISFFNINFFFFVSLSLVMLFLFFFRVFFVVAPVPLWFFAALALKRKVAYHLYIYSFIVLLFFFKGGVLYLRSCFLEIDTAEIIIGDFFFFKLNQLVFSFFLSNSFFLPVTECSSFLVFGVYLNFLSLVTFFQEIQQQCLFFYQWLFFLRLFAVFFVSFLLSFNLFCFFLKKKV